MEANLDPIAGIRRIRAIGSWNVGLEPRAGIEFHESDGIWNEAFEGLLKHPAEYDFCAQHP
jgi:hypothetical protein